jgi:predicted SprT family Zn-dependent metalloprotease
MVESNAYSALEIHAVELVKRILVKFRYPLTRLPVEIFFDYSMKEFASHRVVLESNVSSLSGRVFIRFNGLFLHQSPNEFYLESIPHELAHVFHELACERKGVKVCKPHDMDWLRWLHKINSNADGTVGGSKLFNSEAVKCLSGGIPCSCECPNSNGFKAFPNTKNAISKIRNGEEECSDCGRAYKTISVSDIPKAITQELDFIRGKICTQTAAP